MAAERHDRHPPAMSRRRLSAALVALPFAMSVLRVPATAQQIGEELAGRLTEAQQRAYVFYLRSRKSFDFELQAYWIAVDQKRDERRKKRAAGQAFTRADYIDEHPPKYQGPQLDPEIARIVAALRPPSEPEAPKPVVADFLAHARREFGFVPATTTEKQFKLRYAEESLGFGLTKDQVLRVYALETGGRGTYDMQAGIDPESGKGTPISSALGYAQLLAANSISEFVKYGDGFITRLDGLARRADARNAALIRAKVLALKRMQVAAKSVPNVWAEHVKFGNQPRGMGIHALNLDADIGPWLQAIKLRGVKEEADKAGRTRLSGAEIELMNLAGPRTGLEMMEPVGRTMPTANFFSQGGYYRNTIVREKTAAELLKALDERMEVGLRKPGSLEFAAAFDEAARRLASVPASQRQ